LVDQSLLVRRDGAAGEPRFGMLETVRTFAGERLVAVNDDQRTRQRYAAYILSVVEDLSPELRGPRPEAAAAQVEAELAEVRAALAWALERGAADADAANVGLRLFCAVFPWYYYAALAEGVRWGAALVELPGARQRAARAAAIYATTFLHHTMGTPDRYFPIDGPLLEESIALYRELGDQRGLGLALAVLGGFPQVGDRGRVLQAEAVSVLRQVGDVDALATGLYLLGITAGRWRGDGSTASGALMEALALRRRYGPPAEVARCLLSLGAQRRREHDFAGSLPYVEESVVRSRALRPSWRLVRALNDLGQSLVALDEARALGVFQETLELGREYGPPADLYDCLDGIALLAARHDRAAAAARLWGAIAAWTTPTSARLEHRSYDDTVAAVRTALGEPAFAEAWAVGEALVTDAAFAYGLVVVTEVQQVLATELNASGQRT
jgi:hypothetical protein